MKKIVVMIFFVLLFAVQVYLFIGKEFIVLDYAQYANEEPYPLLGKGGRSRDMVQVFRTPGPLARIDIMLANYKIVPKSGTLRLSLFSGNQEVYFQNYPANTVQDNRFYNFGLDKTGSSGQIPAGIYRMKLNYYPGEPAQALAVWITKESIYPYGNLIVNGRHREGDLTFRVYFYSTIWKEAGRWLGGRSTSQSIFLAISLLILLAAINHVFYYFLKRLLV